MQSHKENPLIFLPGLMGSMGNDIIKGTGDWSFGIARWVYDPFIKELEKMGYILNKNLFICYYDWRRHHTRIVADYLKPLLKRVKEKYPNRKIDLICHSMGGIVARTYIQDNTYEFDINKLIMIGTPNHGTVTAYYFWSTGNLLPNTEGRNFMSLIVRGYIWLLLKLMDISFGIKNLPKIHQNFPSIGELIPSQNYGDFLCYEKPKGEWGMISREYMVYQNDFLDKLNHSSSLALLFSRLHDIACIIGYNFPTPEYLMIDKEKWIYQYEEIILGSVRTLEGDGTVAIKSARLEGAKDCYIEENHKKILLNSFPYIKDIYGLPSANVLKSTEMIEDEASLHILFNGEANIIIYKEKTVIFELYEGEINTHYPYTYDKYPKEYKWIVVGDVPKGLYYMKIDNNKDKKISMMVMSENLKAEERQPEVLAYQQDYIYSFEIN